MSISVQTTPQLERKRAHCIKYMEIGPDSLGKPDLSSNISYSLPINKSYFVSHVLASWNVSFPGYGATNNRFENQRMVPSLVKSLAPQMRLHLPILLQINAVDDRSGCRIRCSPSQSPSTQDSAAVPPDFQIPEAWQQHLSLLGLPRGGLRAFRSLDESWLYQKSNWPPSIERRLHRYMHTTDLYEVTQYEAEGFSKLVDLFVTASGLPNTNAVRQILAAKCQSLVNESSTAWGKEGVIERDSCAWRKSAEFQKLWDAEVGKLKSSRASFERAPSEVDSGHLLDMSSCISDSNNRGMSDDSICAKRNAEEERESTESSKRARRSSSRLAQDDTGAFIILSSGNRRKRASIDVKIEEDDRVSTSVCDDPKSPFGPDFETSEAVAQRNADIWNSIQSSPRTAETGRPQASRSDVTRRKEFGSPAPSEKSSSAEEMNSRRVSAASPRGSIGSVAPGSEWSSFHGSEHARFAVRTPGSEGQADTNPISRRSTPQGQVDVSHQSSSRSPSTWQHRTPLPSRREHSPSQDRATVSSSVVLQSPEIPQPPSSKPSWRDQAAQPYVSSPTASSQKAPASSWKVSDGMHDSRKIQNQGARWERESRVSVPNSPHLDRPPNSSGSTATTHHHIVSSTWPPSNESTRDSGPFMTFPTNFSVLTTESVQRSQAQPPGKKRGRKPGSRNVEQPKADPPGVLLQGVDIPASSGMEDGLPRQAPSTTQQAALPAKSGLPAIPVSHGFYRTKLPPRPSFTPPPGPSAQSLETYRHPAMSFTMDNGVESELGTSDIQSFVDTFKHNARAIISGFSNSNVIHAIDAIMFQSLPSFYRWYVDNTGTTDIGALRFELVDVSWQQEKSFVVTEGNLAYFRILKQHIWDFYWVASDMNKAMDLFRVIISQFPPRADGEEATGPAWKAVSSSIPLAKFNSPPVSQSILVVPTGVPKEFRTPTQFSPPSHTMSLPPPPPPPPPPPLRVMHHASNLSNAHDTQVPAYLRTQHSSSMTAPPRVSSPSQPLYQHGPYQREYLPPRQGGLGSGGTIHTPQSQSLYSPVDKMRTGWDQSLLVDYARNLKLSDATLMHQESTVKDKLPYKTGAEVCAVVVDRMSGKGLVTISGKGYVTLNIPTGPDETGNRFKEVTIQPKQTCMLHGGAVVLYFKSSIPPLPPMPTIVGLETGEGYIGDEGRPPNMTHHHKMNHALSQERYRDDHPLPPPPLKLPSQHNPPAQNICREDSQSSNSTSALEIIIRVQVDGTGKFSTPFDKSVLRPKVTTTEFFSWFASQSKHAPQEPPRHLKFTFKDAMPMPQATEITAGNEDHFNYMRKDIKVQCEKARKFMPESKEFVILVTVPGWVSLDVEEEEDW